MKKTILAGSMVLCMFVALSVPAFAKPGEGHCSGKADEQPAAAATQDNGAAQGEVFGQEAPGGQCGGMAEGTERGKGCGCAHHDAAMEQAGQAGENVTGCGCGHDCKCGCREGGECKCHGGDGCRCGDKEGGCQCGMKGEGGCPMMKDGDHPGCGCGHKDGMEGGHDDKGHKKDHKFWKCPKARGELALTDEQVKKLEDMDADASAKMDAIHTEMKAMKDQMKALLDADPIDVIAIRDLARKMADKKAEKMVIHMVMRAEAMNVLTAEQRGKMKDMHAKMKDGKGPMEQDDADIACPKMMEEKAAALESEAKELDKESKALKTRAKHLREKAKKAKAGKGKGKK